MAFGAVDGGVATCTQSLFEELMDNIEVFPDHWGGYFSEIFHEDVEEGADE